MVEVDASSRAALPYLAVGFLLIHWPDSTDSSASCSLVGRNDILTAGHCVYNPARGGWASGLDFYFGADYNASSATFEEIIAHPSFTQWQIQAWPDNVYADNDNSTLETPEIQYDIALIGINQPIGDSLGWLQLAPGYDGDLKAISVGYPLGSTGMMSETTYVSSNDSYGTYRNPVLTMGPGSSGGPLLADGYVIGVKSTTYSWADIGNSLIYSDLLEAVASNDSLLANGQGDRTPPCITLNSTKHFLHKQETALITFTLSEAANDFTLADVSVGGGTLSQFSGSDRYYSAVFTPANNSIETARIHVDGLLFHDAAGNLNVDGSDYDNTLRLQIDNASRPSDMVKTEIPTDINGNFHGTVADDYYYIWDASTQITEGVDQGMDTVLSNISFTLPANVEHLLLNDGASNGTANSLDNYLRGNSSDNQLFGMAGNDLLEGGAGNDRLDGGAGCDTALYFGKRGDYQLSEIGTSWNVSGGSEGSDSLKDIERVRFADVSLALISDSKTTEIAGILTAVFGKNGISNQEYAGIGLRLLDDGMSYQDVAALAISASGRHGAEEIIDLLWQNLLSASGDLDERQTYVALLNQGMSIGVLGANAADFACSHGVVDLAELQKNGLAYQ